MECTKTGKSVILASAKADGGLCTILVQRGDEYTCPLCGLAVVQFGHNEKYWTTFAAESDAISIVPIPTPE